MFVDHRSALTLRELINPHLWHYIRRFHTCKFDDYDIEELFLLFVRGDLRLADLECDFVPTFKVLPSCLLPPR